MVSAAVPLAMVCVAVAVGAVGTPSFESTVTLILCNLIIVLGLQIFIGNSGIYSFGQLGFAMAGAYLAAALVIPAALTAFQTPGLPHLLAEAQLGPLAATLAAAVASAVLALVVGLALMRTSTLAIPISTFAFLVVIYNVVANWETVTGGSGGLVGIPATTKVETAGLWAGAAVLVALAFKWSASGYRLQATREDEVAARSLGIGVMRERMLAFVLSAALCGAGGALAVQQSGVLTPDAFYFAATVTTLTMLIVGGPRSVLGATLGTLSVAAVNEMLRSFEEGHSVLGLPAIGEVPGLAAIGLGLILLVAMIALPDGLSGGREAGEFGNRRGPGKPAPPVVQDRTSSVGRAGRHEGGALVTEGISLTFGGLQVLEEVGLHLERGEVLGLIGPNGAGKTTLVNVISGFQRPDAGGVSMDGIDISGWSPAQLARQGLTRSFQAALPFAHLSCLESVAVGALAVGAGRREATAQARYVLSEVGLLGKADRPAGSLPAGSRRLLGIARALATRPRYLLLDEPAAGLNEKECLELVGVLRAVVGELGCGLLLIDHDMNVVIDLCSRVQVLDEGRTVAVGAPEDVQNDPAVVESYLGSDFAVAAGA
jgi:branched-chain amino acid transport system permease protein